MTLKIRQSIIFLNFFLMLIFSSHPLYANEIIFNSCPAEIDLLEHLSMQIDDRIEGVTANNTTKQLYSTRGNLTAPWVKNPNVWTNNETPIDFTGMSPWNSRGGYARAGTLITPRHIALAHHYPLNVGDTVLFVADDNTTVTRTVSAVQRVLSTDISIAKLSSDVPETITHYPIIDKTDFEAYISDGFNMGVFDIPILVLDQQDHVIIKEIRKNDLFLYDRLSYHPSQEIVRLSFNETLIGGDSGNPGLVLLNNIPVLLTTHTFSFSGPSYSYHKEDIQNVINNMGGEHQLSTIDLDCFNASIVLDNNTSLKVVEGETGITSVGTIDIKYNIENSTPYFSIASGNDDGVFAIDSTTGEIITTDQVTIDGEDFPRTIEVAVEEDAPGGRMSKNLYTISLATYPYFNVQDYSFEINEHVVAGTSVGAVQADDNEDDTLEYSIIPGNDDGIFAINSSTGVITVANSDLLDFETADTHQLTIQAKESNTLEELSTTIEVTITVNDLNYDFSQVAYSFEIDELDENTTVVGSVDSNIVDTISINSTHYSIISGNNDGIFAINSSTGQITVIDNADLDGNQIYNLVIGASEDVGLPVLNSVPVTVQVTHTTRPTLSYQAQQTSLVRFTVEEGSSVSMIFELSAPYTKTIVATLAQTLGSAILNTDYTLSTDTLTFLPGETSKTVTLNALTDSINEPDETVLIAIMDNTRVSVGPRANATITIKNKAPRSSGGGGGGGSSSPSVSKEPETQTPIVSPQNQAPEPPLIPNTLPTTREGLVTLLTQLQARLAQLLSSTQQIQTPTNTNFTRDLTLNSQGEDVTMLQQLLISRGYSIPAGATGFFGEQTRQALINFQRANNITPAVGYFGQITRMRMSQ